MIGAATYCAKCAKWCAKRNGYLCKSLILLAQSTLRNMPAQSAAKRGKVQHSQGFAGASGRVRKVAPLRGKAALGARRASRLPPSRSWGRELRQNVRAVVISRDTSSVHFIERAARDA